MNVSSVDSNAYTEYHTRFYYGYKHIQGNIRSSWKWKICRIYKKLLYTMFVGP